MQKFTLNGHLYWLRQILGHIANLCISYHWSVILNDKHNNTVLIYCFNSTLLHVSAAYISRY